MKNRKYNALLGIFIVLIIAYIWSSTVQGVMAMPIDGLSNNLLNENYSSIAFLGIIFAGGVGLTAIENKSKNKNEYAPGTGNLLSFEGND